MKKTVALLLALALMFSMAACGVGGSSSDNNDDPQSSGQQEQSGSETEQDENVGQTDPPDETGAADVPESLEDGSTPAGANEIDQSQVYEAWAPLVGYWHAADGRFFQLDMADSHSAWFEEGIWDTGYGRGGYVTDLSLAENTIHQGTVHFDAVEATEMDEARPAEDAAIRVDWADLDNDGKIRITVGDETYYCAFAGQTAEEAYAVHQQNMADIAAAQ